MASDSSFHIASEGEPELPTVAHNAIQPAANTRRINQLSILCLLAKGGNPGNPCPVLRQDRSSQSN